MPEISKHEAETNYQKAANAELSRDFDKAFRLYLRAADQFLHLSRQSADERMRTLCKTEATKALERAEKIKAVKQDVRPVARDEFAESQQLYVLQKSSLVNQGFFPLWDSPDKPSSSSQQPPLSAEQIEHGAIWARPIPASPESLEPEDIIQHIVSDCSVCASMVVATDHCRRFGSKMILSSLFPQGNNGFPTTSSTGKYQFRILFNGAYRRVPVDDQLPSYPDGTLMCVSTGSKGQLWPSLVEKAYMKLAGGYDFIGSDSSTDMHALAGWIPEVFDIRGSNFQREKTWQRLFRGYTDGKCVATFGTGERVRSVDLPIVLLPTHCYAVIGMRDSGDERSATVFDPWVQSSNAANSDNAGSMPPRRPRAVSLSMESMFALFDGLYLSWNPAMFRYQSAFHGMWRRDGRGSETSAHFRARLQLDVATDMQDDTEIWILLTRHLRSHRAQEEYIALTAHGGSSSPSASSLGHDVLSTKGEYTNSQHVLLRIPASRAEQLITLVASYEGERDDVGFTLTVYANCPVTWAHQPQALLYTKDIDSAFTQKTAGGNHTYPTYYLNPQYHLRVHPRAGSRGAARDAKATLSLAVSTDRHVPMNLMLAWSQGGRIDELGHNDLALSSGPYSYGYAHTAGKIPPGDYTLVVSAFEPRHVSKFALRAECSDRFELTPILQEGAGMFSKLIRGEWTERTAGGGPSTGTYASNPMYELQVTVAAQLKFRLQFAAPFPSASLNLTVFNVPSAGSSASLGRHIATSGPYSDAVSGVLIERLTLQPGRYLVVPSTHSAGVEAGFRLIVYSNAAGVQLVPAQR